MKKPTFAILAFLLALLALSCGRRDPVVGRFNGEPILLSAVAAEMTREGKPWRRSGWQSRMTAVSNMILRDLFLLDARKKGYFERQDIIDILEKQKKELVKRMVIEKVVGTPSVSLAAGDVRKFTSIVNCRLIFFNGPVSLDGDYRKMKSAEARSCYSLVNPGNFSEMADLYTDYPGNLKGGFLGALPASNLPPAVRSAVARMTPGQISDILQSDRGFTIVRLEKVEKALSAGAGDKYHVSSIFLSASATNREAVLQKARELWRRLTADPSQFKELANRWSEDPANRNGGRLRPFVYEQMTPLVAEAAWKTPKGRVSRILSDRSGFYILLVDSIRPRSAKELSEFRKNRQYYRSLKQRILQRKAVKIREDRFGKYRERLLAGARVIRDYSCFTNSSLTNADAAGAAVLLKVLYNNTAFTYADFLEQFRREAARFGGRPSYIDKVNVFESRLLVPELVFADGLRRGFMQSGRFKKEYAEFCDNTVFSRYFKDLVDSRPVGDQEIREFYEANKDRFEKYPFEKVRDLVRRQLTQDLQPVIARQRMTELLQAYKLDVDPWKLMNRRERALERLRLGALRAEQSSNLQAAAAGWSAVLKKDPSNAGAAVALFRCALALGAGAEGERFTAQAVSAVPRNAGGISRRLDDPSERSAALRLLASSGCDQAVQSLVRRLQSPDRSLLPEILRVLGELKAVPARDPILAVLRAERRNIIAASNLPVVASASLALGRIGGESAGAYLVSWLRTEKDYRLQSLLLPAVAEFRDASQRQLLAQYLGSPSPEVRRAAVAALSTVTNSGKH
jgi:parvulin-like peptidyl-prolyl isomerase